jgi:hypothetical protein
MAINIFYGRMDGDASVEQNYAKVRELIAGFEKQFGHLHSKCFRQ